MLLSMTPLDLMMMMMMIMHNTEQKACLLVFTIIFSVELSNISQPLFKESIVFTRSWSLTNDHTCTLPLVWLDLSFDSHVIVK